MQENYSCILELKLIMTMSKIKETTTTGNTGDVSNSVHGWENDPERKKKLVQMLKTNSVADVVKQLTKSTS